MQLDGKRIGFSLTRWVLWGLPTPNLPSPNIKHQHYYAYNSRLDLSNYHCGLQCVLYACVFKKVNSPTPAGRQLLLRKVAVRFWKRCFISLDLPSVPSKRHSNGLKNVNRTTSYSAKSHVPFTSPNHLRMHHVRIMGLHAVAMDQGRVRVLWCIFL